MEKNKIPIWENIKDYIPELDFIVDSLLAISDRDYQLRVWYGAQGPEVDWYYESLLNFEYEVDYFKHFLRTKQVQLTKEQIKAIIKTYVLFDRFDRMLEDDEIPKGWAEGELYIINHPYWNKVRRQAQFALSLLKKDK